MLNPDGLARGVRENSSGIDLNRDYRHLQAPEVRAHIGWLRRQPNFDLAVCVHEDWESTGFYLYELNPDSRPSLAPPILKAVSKVCPIDMSPTIEGREAKGGVIRPKLDPQEREKWPESIYLQVNHTRLSYTIETPSALPIETRVAAHRAALFAAIDRTVRPAGLGAGHGSRGVQAVQRAESRHVRRAWAPRRRRGSPTSGGQSAGSGGPASAAGGGPRAAASIPCR